MIEPEDSANALQTKEERRRTGSRRRSLEFKRKRSSFATAEQWAHCIEHPPEAKTISGREWIVCLVCRQLCKTLGLHLKPHNLSARWYRELFGYPSGEALICDELAEELGRKADEAPRGTAEELAKAREGKQPLRAREWILCPGSKAQPCGLKLRQITRLHVRKHGFDTLNQFRDEWLYPWKGAPLACEEISEQSRELAKANLKPGVKGVAPPIRRKGYKMSRAFSLKQSARKRSKPRPKRGLGKKTGDLLSLCAAFEKKGTSVYAMATIVYPGRDQQAAEAATRLLRKRHRGQIDRLRDSMPDVEAERRIADAKHP